MITKRFISSAESYVDTESIIDYNLGRSPFEHNYSPLTKIKLHLVALSNQFGLGEVSFKPRNKNDWESIDSFYIESPNDWSYENTVKYAEEEGILSTLNSVTIIIN